MNYLIGEKLGYSYSTKIHSYFGDSSYNLKEIKPNDLDRFFKDKDFDGLNITIPYKEQVMRYVDELSETAKAVGCVNTIINDDGTLYGFNTDVFGFIHQLEYFKINVEDKKVLILGSGGASKAVKYACTLLKSKSIDIVSRTGEINYTNLYDIDAQVIVNATPFGTNAENSERLVDLSKFRHLESVIDLVYNPLNTELLQQAKVLGVNFCNGLFMLVDQARMSSLLFMGIDVDLKQYDNSIRIYKKLLNEIRNIVLIGMPGVGKSTLGKSLSKELGLDFVDTDSLIEERIGNIEAYINKNGEESFRKVEKEIIEKVSKLNRTIIATGGGSILEKDNRFNLRRNSIIIWLDRDVSTLKTDGRPLSKNNNLEDLYQEREIFYDALSDFVIEMDGKDVSACIEEIRGIL